MNVLLNADGSQDVVLTVYINERPTKGFLDIDMLDDTLAEIDERLKDPENR